jgi:hypothetical protein
LFFCSKRDSSISERPVTPPLVAHRNCPFEYNGVTKDLHSRGKKRERKRMGDEQKKKKIKQQQCSEWRLLLVWNKKKTKKTKHAPIVFGENDVPL